MLNIAVCDDNKECLDEICACLKNYFSEKFIEYNLYRYSCGEELAADYEKSFDIAFLDVEMKKINGIQTGYELRKSNPDIHIFVITSYTQYLDDAMDLRVFRYIEKPIDTRRICRGMDAVLSKNKKYEFISEGIKIELHENEIAYIYKSHRKSILVKDNDSSISTDMTIKEWLELFKESNSFSSPHYSYIVNLNYVSINERSVKIQLKNGRELEVYPSRRRFKQFKDDFYSKTSEYR